MTLAQEICNRLHTVAMKVTDSRSFRLSDSRNFRLSASMTVMVLSMVFPPDFVSNVSIKPLAFNREMTSTAVCRFTPK